MRCSSGHQVGVCGVEFCVPLTRASEWTRCAQACPTSSPTAPSPAPSVAPLLQTPANDAIQNLRKVLPPDAYTMQATLSNGRRADCLIHLPNPPGPIVVDSKFPLEAYEALRRAETPAALTEAARGMRMAVRAHIRAIRAYAVGM